MRRTIIIIEDEPFSAERLKELILSIEPNAIIEPTINNVDDVIARLRSPEPYSLIFADIQINGGDVFAAFRLVMPRSFVIFTTAFNDYAMRAIKSNGIDYLLKPFERADLAAALAKTALSAVDNDDVQERLAALISDSRYWRKRIMIYRGDALEPVNVEDVNFFVIRGDKVVAHLKSGGEYFIRQSMSDIENELNPVSFLKISRQYMVNIRAVKGFKFGLSKCSVKIEGCDDGDVSLSRSKAIIFRNWIDR